MLQARQKKKGLIAPALAKTQGGTLAIPRVYMLWFNFILGLNFISLCFKLIIIYYHTPKQREIKFKPRIKLNHNIYIQGQRIFVVEKVRNVFVVGEAFLI